MKTCTKFLAGAVALMTLVMGIISCSVESEELHQHTYSKEWTSDATNHWHAATCEHKTEVKDKAAHTFGDAVVTKESTETEEGEKLTHAQFVDV